MSENSNPKSEHTYNGIFLVVDDFKNINIDNIETLFKEYNQKNSIKLTAKDITDKIRKINNLDSLGEIYDNSAENNVYETEYYSEYNSEYNSEYEYHNNNDFYNIEVGEIEIFINKRHSHIDNNFKEFSLLNTYIKGQINILNFTNKIHLFKYYAYLFFILLFSICATVSAGENTCNDSINSLIATLNICITLLTTLKDLFNYKTRSDIAVLMIEQYNKIELNIETTNSKLIVNENENEKQAILKEKTIFLEEKMNEIKEMFHYQNIDEVDNVFPITSNLKLFSFLKLVKMYEKILFIKLANIINEIRFILYKWQNNDGSRIISQRFLQNKDDSILSREQSKMHKKPQFKQDFSSRLKELDYLCYLFNFMDFIKNEFINTHNIVNKINFIYDSECMNVKKKYLIWVILMSLFISNANKLNENEIFTNLMVL